jgi:hypothetical protein
MARTKTVVPAVYVSSANGLTAPKRTMSAAVRVISKKAKERWAKMRAEKAKKAK